MIFLIGVLVVIGFIIVLAVIKFIMDNPWILVVLFVTILFIFYNKMLKKGKQPLEKQLNENKPIEKQNTYGRSNSKYNKNRSYRKNQNQSACSKGDDFENFVAKQFNNNSDYTVISWTGDKMRKYNVYVESDSGPDLKIRHEPTQEEFYIECKYRSTLHKGKYKWTNDEQRKRYLDFDSNNKEPFYIALGLGGSPSKPDKVFCVPLREARYVGLYPFVFEKYYHNPEVDLVWKNGILR